MLPFIVAELAKTEAGPLVITLGADTVLELELELETDVEPDELELEFEVDNYQYYNKIMDEIKQKFSDIVRNVEFVLIQKEHKYIWMPESYSPS